MQNEGAVRMPDEVEMLAFFGAEPQQRAPSDGYWSYAVTDASGTGLRLSFDIFERSVQVVLSLHGEESATISHEGLAALSLYRTNTNSVLIAEMLSADTESRLQIEIDPRIRVRWSTLLVR